VNIDGTKNRSSLANYPGLTMPSLRMCRHAQKAMEDFFDSDKPYINDGKRKRYGDSHTDVRVTISRPPTTRCSLRHPLSCSRNMDATSGVSLRDAGSRRYSFVGSNLGLSKHHVREYSTVLGLERPRDSEEGNDNRCSVRSRSPQ
jgi:hypothetical protein